MDLFEQAQQLVVKLQALVEQMRLSHEAERRLMLLQLHVAQSEVERFRTYASEEIERLRAQLKERNGE